jgi:hypothetical protein
MQMHRVALVSLSLTILCTTGVLAAPKVAVVYSSWGNYSFRDEFDGHLQKLGWSFEKFENKDIATLIPRLSEFDIVLATAVSNYENTVDMTPFKDSWVQFLNRGGLLLITDASYGSVLEQWTNRLGDRFALTTKTCARHTRAGADPDRQDFDPADTILYTPQDLAGELRSRSTWAHIVPLSKEWHSLVACADDQSFFVYQDVAQGCLAVTSYFSFKGQAHTPAATALLENLWTHVQGLRGGAVLTRLELGPALPGTSEVRLGLRSSLAQTSTFEVSLAVTEAGQDKPETSKATVTLPAGGVVEVGVPYTLTRRGEAQLSVQLGAVGKPPLTLTRRVVVPALVDFRLPVRHAYPWQTKLAWSASLAPESNVKLADLTADLVLDDKSVATFPAPEATLSGEADLTGVAIGDHRLGLRLRRGETILGMASQTLTTHAMPRVYVRPKDLTTLVDGKPFFPMGFYHVSWTFSAEDRMQFLQEVAAAGYNTVHASLKQMDEWDPFLTEAEKLNVMVLTEFGVDRTAAIERYRGRKPILAWNPGDEPDGQGIAPEEMLERHNAIKSIDATVPTYMTLCVPSAYKRYAAMAEVIAPDPYPIRHASASTLPVYTSISQAVAAATPLGRPIWAIPQAFGYKDLKSWRVPTFAEERNMTYLALLAGAKGLVYYTYRDNGFNMRENPELWDGMKTLPAEIKALEPFLLEGNRVTLETGTPDLIAGHWTTTGRNVICIANASSTETRDVSLALPQGVAGKAVNLFANRPGGLEVRNGKLTGKVGPLEVHVYEIK